MNKTDISPDWQRDVKTIRITLHNNGWQTGDICKQGIVPGKENHYEKLLAGCGGGGSASPGGSDSGSGVAITIFNSKMEIQDKLEEKAAEYSEEKGVDVEAYYSSDTVAAHLATRYSSNEPYTISMVDAKDVYALAAEHALDLTGEDWTGKTTQAITIDDKVYGFPVCIEARGIIYNADAIKNVTGEDFDPASIKTTADFKALLDKLVAGGMAAPCGVMKEDWSLAAHFLAEVYEQRDDPDAFIAGIQDGSVSLEKDPKFNALMDTFDLLKTYNYAKDAGHLRRARSDRAEAG